MAGIVMHHQPLPAIAAPINGWLLYIWWMGEVGPSSIICPSSSMDSSTLPSSLLDPSPWKTLCSLVADSYVFCCCLLQQPPPMLEDANANTDKSNAR
jgi:hypothetical protein